MSARLDRRLVVVGAGALALVVLVVLAFASGASEQRRLDRARRAEVAQRKILKSTRNSVAAENRALAAAYVTGAKLAKELVVGNADVAFTQNDLNAAVTALQRARSVLSSQSNRRAIIGQCLAGVRLALDATQRGNTAAANRIPAGRGTGMPERSHPCG